MEIGQDCSDSSGFRNFVCLFLGAWASTEFFSWGNYVNIYSAFSGFSWCSAARGHSRNALRALQYNQNAAYYGKSHKKELHWQQWPGNYL